ncbi:MAG: sugar ABC transporter permease [Actinobacteria bacterium]|nr:sugar ABC transporter permease [Actinomycetota bacterium]
MNIEIKKVRKTSGIEKANTRFALLIILPAFILAGIILYYPILNSILMAFQNVFFGRGKFEWIGFENFKAIFERSDFIKTFSWTLAFGVISTLLLLIIGMYFAVLLNRKMPGRNFIRGLLLVPWAIPVFVNSFLWLWLLDTQFGFFNYILMALHIIKEPLNWIGQTAFARLAIVMAYVWRVFPFNMIVYLAAFQTIDPVLYEAAEMDGAGKFKQFLHITLPQVRNIIIFTALLNFIWSFQEFTTIWIMTKGGPVGSTNTLITRIYNLAFQNRNFGAAAANGSLWIVFLIIFSIIYLRVLFFREEKE